MNTTKVEKSSGQFEKGHEKIGGRKKGTPNKRTVEITERLKDEDILGSLIEIAKTTDEESIKVKIYLDLLRYCYPQRKAIEFTQDIELPVINIKGI